jgi:hypothetical protein
MTLIISMRVSPRLIFQKSRFERTPKKMYSFWKVIFPSRRANVWWLAVFNSTIQFQIKINTKSARKPKWNRLTVSPFSGAGSDKSAFQTCMLWVINKKTNVIWGYFKSFLRDCYSRHVTRRRKIDLYDFINSCFGVVSLASIDKINSIN